MGVSPQCRSPETWKVVRLNTIPNRPIRFTLFDEFVATLQSWLADWSRSGSNAFIHSELYASRVPAPVGDVFTALTSYFHRAPETEPMVFRIVEDRITNLVATETLEPSDVLGHLSRVHALMGYSIICLFHGDIRLRRVAEVNLQLLVSWSQDMLKATARAASNGQLLYSEMVNALAFLGTDAAARSIPPQHELQAAWQHLGEAEKETALWHTWVVTESVRRAWVTARAVETIYLTLRDRGAACPGGLIFTMSKSVWEANSALAWTKACAESDTGFLHIWDTDRLCVQPTSDAIDEFAKVMIKLNFRTDRASTWAQGECGS
ncbi:putative rna polymerase ii mediator complex component protein [Phaeoacremonium minimum UCRPA7]|uniref:Putative rna polymerase ii mediator complex component protein n=1 Tax=Phaeoacremonium minimum (strain UCR-PA7) TaxID=1286976 RepID=R8BVH7_PHAM7|nr:putative rna polymerase ii mediator complex component protein [Phaeoacremonium minimum UCRPA7]EOO03309.1 putative rna polymerase ii mediator complex component protein [Phaeoacremonium minimum UCRPA7]